MRASLHAMRDRRWIWDGFYDGIKGSLSEEFAKDNLKPAYVIDFAENMGIDSQKILPLIEEKEWNALIKTLLKLLPRSGDYDRYDM